MKVLSICGGIETGYLALKNVGIPVEEYHTFEINENAIKVSKHHFPEIIHHGNLIGADFSQFKGFDLVIGGTCCQSLSKTRIENKSYSAGLDGKSGIFFEYVRAIEEIKPKYWMLENVVPNKEDDLNRMNEALGVQPVPINSSMFSAQDRERLYWANFEIIPPTEDRGGLRLMHILEDRSPDLFDYIINKPYEWHGLEKRVCATLQINTLDMLKRVYSPLFKAPTLTCVSGGYQEKKVWDCRYNAPRKLTPLEYERLQTLPDGFTGSVGLTDTQRRSLCGNGWTLKVIEYIFRFIKED